MVAIGSGLASLESKSPPNGIKVTAAAAATTTTTTRINISLTTRAENRPQNSLESHQVSPTDQKSMKGSFGSAKSLATYSKQPSKQSPFLLG